MSPASVKNPGGRFFGRVSNKCPVLCGRATGELRGAPGDPPMGCLSSCFPQMASMRYSHSCAQQPLFHPLLCLSHSLACFAPQAPFEAAEAGKSNDRPPMEGPSCGLGTVLSSSAKARYLILIAALQWDCYRILVLGMRTEDQRG